MSSSAQIVTRALKRLRVLGAGEEPAAEDAADGLAALNSMIASWEGKGVKVATDIPLDARFEQGVVAMLAVRLAPDHGKQVDAVTAQDADDGWRALQAAFVHIPIARADSALRNAPSSRYWTSVGNYQLWAARREQSVGDLVQSNGHLYECTVAGTTGILNPLSTSSAIPDGTVTWKFVRGL